MVRHIVSWNFKPELTPQQRQAIGQEVVEKLTALKGKVPVLKSIRVFCPHMDSSSCDLVLYSEVEQ